MNLLLNVIIRKREGIVFKGLVKSITSLNDKGTFDILPMHTNFVAVIRDKLTIVKENNEAVNMAIGRGIMRVKKNQAEIYLGI